MKISFTLARGADNNLSLGLQLGNVETAFDPDMTADYLIIGAGIAGSLLSRALAKHGKRVVLLGSPQLPGSSRAAAWMLNPVTGLRFSVSWRIESLLPFAKTLYRELEKESGLELLHEQRILRFLKSGDELTRVKKKGSDPFFRHYTSLIGDPKTGPIKEPEPLIGWDSHGCLEILGGGWVDLNRWLDYHRENPTSGVEYVSGHLLAEELLVKKEQVEWNGRIFSKAIFCTGYSQWPWFDWLPWKAAKGETLTLRIPGLGLRDILKKDIFLIPLGDDLYRAGTTYSWTPLDDHPTKEGRNRMLQSLRSLTPLPVEVVSHHAGVRPSFQGTIPAVGLHPRHPALGIFNGLGSKGGLSAPWLAEHLARHLGNGCSLDAEVDIARNR